MNSIEQENFASMKAELLSSIHKGTEFMSK